MTADTKARLRAHARSRAPIAALAVVAAITLLQLRGPSADEGDPRRSLAAALLDEGLDVDPRSLTFVGEPNAIGARPAIFVARKRGELADVYYADVRTSGTAVLDVLFLTNLTHTSSAEEEAPVRLGSHLAYLSRVGDAYDAVSILDTAGEPAELTRDWPRRAKLQNAITNIQETGRARGLGRRRYSFATPTPVASLVARDDRFVASLGGQGTLEIDPSVGEPVAGAALAELRPTEKGRPGGITWIVDTVRNTSLVGSAPIEWLEHRVFSVKDWVERRYYGAVGTDTAAEVLEDLSFTNLAPRRRAELTATNPEIGWPPRAIEPVLDPVRGEGEWNPIVDDPFVRPPYPNAPPAFYQTFIRADRERDFTRVYVTIWDPRQIQLHIVSGTNEPESATGETGTGTIPRDRDTLTHLVGAFNGGFQALHGEFGMMADRHVYLPPKPWAATVAVFDDGRVGIGSWMDPPPGTRVFEERWAVAQIPEDMVAMRQNLTTVVEDGQYNPWGRWWWGAAPLNAGEQTYIDRTGLCLTEEGFLAYFWGQSMGPEALGRAMLATRCVRGVHLDMNSRHTGFEFYGVYPDDALPPALTADTGEHQFEGRLPELPGYVVRTRLAVRSMTPMRFPRYVRTDGRDFFYLTQRAVLPGANLAVTGGAEGEGVFSAAGLPHAGWPPAFARAFLGAHAGARTFFVRIDGSRVTFEGGARETDVGADAQPLAFLTAAHELADDAAPFALYETRGMIGRHHAVGPPPASARVIVSGPALAGEPNADAALGVDGDGFIVYAERQPGEDTSLATRLAVLGVTAAVALPEDVRLALVLPSGETIAPDTYQRDVSRETSVALLAHTRPRTEVLYPETRPRPYSAWSKMQDSRVRYFREGPPRFIGPGSVEP